ncbi:HupE/UreJ family protein [Roseisalinus antarcticus]|uniref:HupE / UreJ protein n=1 Tax=Roseisalinus antarcticus TaxID=254357 RepID=A0A1Y5SN42_9RHOB|nr:HupE/UreJ family protein [Roseisalinus antarcticus]SLN44495.1 HupE / UreJ protein [Roseisalinus antarcticus]
MKRFSLAAAATTLAATPALAHHPLGGLPMETFAHGAMSGVGHPVLGFDHLFFVAAMGIAALFTQARFTAPLAYVAAMVLGCVAAYAGLALPAVEVVIVLSLLTVGGVILSGRALTLGPALALFAGFGLFHGAAFAGALAGQEGGVGGAVLAGYLLFLGLTQYALAIGAQFAARGLLGATAAGSVNARLAGAAVAGVGVFLALEMLEGPIVAAIAG